MKRNQFINYLYDWKKYTHLMIVMMCVAMASSWISGLAPYLNPIEVRQLFAFAFSLVTGGGYAFFVVWVYRAHYNAHFLGATTVRSPRAGVLYLLTPLFLSFFVSILTFFNVFIDSFLLGSLVFLSTSFFVIMFLICRQLLLSSQDIQNWQQLKTPKYLLIPAGVGALMNPVSLALDMKWLYLCLGACCFVAHAYILKTIMTNQCAHYEALKAEGQLNQEMLYSDKIKARNYLENWDQYTKRINRLIGRGIALFLLAIIVMIVLDSLWGPSLLADNQDFGGVGILNIVLFLIPGFVIMYGIALSLAWFYKANHNARFLGVKSLRFSPMMGVVLMYVPIVNIFTTYMLYKQLILSSQERQNWKNLKRPPFLLFWWILSLIIPGLGEIIGLFLMLDVMKTVARNQCQLYELQKESNTLAVA